VRLPFTSGPSHPRNILSQNTVSGFRQRKIITPTTAEPWSKKLKIDPKYDKYHNHRHKIPQVGPRPDKTISKQLMNQWGKNSIADLGKYFHGE
jgi:hypothetical protein